MKNKTKGIIRFCIPPLFWLGVWEVLALCIGDNYILPDIYSTVQALWGIVSGESFLVTVLMTLFRVLVGLVLGITIGIALAVLSHHVSMAKSIVSPMVSVIKATPVASFIVLLWAVPYGYTVPVFIALLMVMPIVWQNMMDGYSYIDVSMTEVCDVFEFSYIKRVKHLIAPTLARYLIPAVITSVGLAWKAEIAAEIIDFTEKSIGSYIKNSQKDFDSAAVFAWTVIIIIFSLVLEKATKMLLRRYKYGPQT